MSAGTRESTLSGVGGVTLHRVEWECALPQAVVVLIHGYAEHIGRYQHVADRLAAEHYRVVGYDHRGHGLSTGVTKGTIDSFEALVDDLATVIDSVGTDLPIFLYGHSMGGLVAARYLERSGEGIAGAVLASALLKSADSIPAVLVKVANVLGKIAPKLPTIALDGAAISRDGVVRASYDSDPLNYRGKLTAGTGAQMNLTTAAAFADAAKITAPLLVLHGSADALTDVEGSRRFASVVGSSDVTFSEYQGCFHELHNEPEKEAVLDEIVAWLNSHRSASASATE